MRVSRVIPYSLSAVLLCGGLLVLSGCDSGPAPGTAATPVQSEEAASQNKAMRDFYKSKGKKTKSLQAP